MASPQVDPLGAIYAEALAQAAEAEGGVDLLGEVGDRLAALDEAWREDRMLRAYFLSAQVPTAEQEATLDRLAQEQPRILGNFLRIVFRRERFDRLPQIAGAFATILDRKLGRVAVTLTTAAPVPEDMVRRWVERLREATGQDPVLKHVVKPELLAGAVLQVGDAVADGSARRRLAELRKNIVERGHHAIEA